MVSRARQAFRSGRARRMREGARLSIRQLAAMAGVGHSTLARWERGEFQPSAEGVLAWAEAMGRLGFTI